MRDEGEEQQNDLWGGLRENNKEVQRKIGLESEKKEN